MTNVMLEFSGMRSRSSHPSVFIIVRREGDRASKKQVIPGWLNVAASLLSPSCDLLLLAVWLVCLVYLAMYVTIRMHSYEPY